jgi:DNA-binding MarR family transcriptional regulator
MGMAAERSGGGGRTLLEDLSHDLNHIAVMLTRFAEVDAARREAGIPVTAQQVRALIAARHARSAVFGLDLANPGWSLLLELYRARLEGRPARMERLATDARLAATTVLRWLDLLRAAGFAERRPDPERSRQILIALTDAGAEAMHDYFAAIAAGWG